jgi:hypothetical protein
VDGDVFVSHQVEAAISSTAWRRQSRKIKLGMADHTRATRREFLKVAAIITMIRLPLCGALKADISTLLKEEQP